MDLRLSRLALAALPLGLAAGLAPAPAFAAASLEACTGFIDSLPATITSQGNWCLRKDLATAITSGAAITIAANNVTLDCNRFKIGGLAAGDASTAYGLSGQDRQNVTIRDCTVRGFFRGIHLSGLDSSGLLVEDNIVDQSLSVGIYLAGTGHLVRGNRVLNTGGGGGNGFMNCALITSGDVIDNTIETVTGFPGNNSACGMELSGYGYEVRDNRVRDILPTGTGLAFGIRAPGLGTRVTGNHVSNPIQFPGIGIRFNSADSYCSNNVTHHFAVGIQYCSHASGNLPAP